MEISTDDVDRSHVLISYDDAFWIGVGVEFTMDLEIRISGSGAYEVDNDAIADQPFGVPVYRDEREQAVFDLVPLAGARRQVVDANVDAKLIGETLQFAFPQAQARAVAATAIPGSSPGTGDQQALGVRISDPADLVPPPADRLHREGCRIMVHARACPRAGLWPDPWADPARIGSQIIDAINLPPRRRGAPLDRVP
jgi:hypothetical protein